ncbi:MAG: tetratricopeptide repeat protein [Bacteroidales bacterium]|nr:tetratricopeptide repeat protein [Bacteroidales bacterium]
MAFDDDNFMDDELDVNELVSRFEDMVKQHQSYYFDTDELNVILEHYLQQDNIKRANLAADIAIKFHPNDPMIQIIKAKQLLANSHAKEALSTLKNAAVDKEDADYQITLGYCYSELQEHKKAINAYMKAVKAFEFKECEDLFNSIAIEYENLGDYEKALNYHIKGLNRKIDIDNQYFEIRNCYSILNRLEDALDFFRKEIDLDPYSVPAWTALGNCYIRMGRLDDAIEQLEYVLAIDPHNKKAYIDIATAYNETGKYAQTLETVAEATRCEAESPLLLCLYGEAHAKLGDMAEAMKSYKKAMKIDENLPEAYAGIGFILSDENNPKSAIKFLKHAHALSPYNTDYMFVMAEEYNKLEEYDKALKIVNEILSQNPYDENAYITLMECYVLKDDVENAFLAINRGLSILGDNAPLLYRKAFIHFAENENESGLLTLESALEIDYDGHIEFLNFDAENLTNNAAIMELIEEYRIKNKK